MAMKLFSKRMTPSEYKKIHNKTDANIDAAILRCLTEVSLVFLVLYFFNFWSFFSQICCSVYSLELTRSRRSAST